MKLLFENWRKYLNEQDTVLPTTAFVTTPSVGMGGARTVVVVQTSEGPTAFYKSTGTGTGEESRDMWLPVGGIAQRSNGNQWFAKLPSSHPQAKNSKFPKEGSEFWNIGKQLGAKSIREVDWKDWISSKGWPSFQKMEKITNDKIFRGAYGFMAMNLYLSENGALKPEWAPDKLFYGIHKGLLGAADGGATGAEYTIEDLKKIIASGKIIPGEMSMNTETEARKTGKKTKEDIQNTVKQMYEDLRAVDQNFKNDPKLRRSYENALGAVADLHFKIQKV